MYSTSTCTCINLQSIKQLFRYGCIYSLCTCRMTCKKWTSIHIQDVATESENSTVNCHYSDNTKLHVHVSRKVD